MVVGPLAPEPAGGGQDAPSTDTGPVDPDSATERDVTRASDVAPGDRVTDGVA